MRALHPITLIAIATLILTQNPDSKADPALPPEEFAGLKWGASREEVKAAMEAKGAGILSQYTTDSHFGFQGGSIAGLPVHIWDLYFVSDKFSRGLVYFDDKSDLEGLFKQLKKTLTEKYGARKSETFKPADPSADWRLVKSGSNGAIIIRLWVGWYGNEKRLSLEYKNEALEKLAPEHAASKIKSDGL
jgi:hypothetical protein